MVSVITTANEFPRGVDLSHICHFLLSEDVRFILPFCFSFLTLLCVKVTPFVHFSVFTFDGSFFFLKTGSIGALG